MEFKLSMVWKQISEVTQMARPGTKAVSVKVCPSNRNLCNLVFWAHCTRKLIRIGHSVHSEIHCPCLLSGHINQTPRINLSLLTASCLLISFPRIPVGTFAVVSFIISESNSFGSNSLSWSALSFRRTRRLFFYTLPAWHVHPDWKYNGHASG